MPGETGFSGRVITSESIYRQYVEKYVKPNILIPGHVTVNMDDGSPGLGLGRLREVGSFLEGDWAKSQPWYGSYELARNGDYSEFEKVDPLAQNYLASRYIIGRLQRSDKGYVLLQPEHNEEALEKLLQEEKHNPLFRLGCSLISHTNYNNSVYNLSGIKYRSESTTDYQKRSRYMASKISGNEQKIMQYDEVFREYDDRMTEMIMEDTLRPMTETQIQNVHQMAGSSEKAEQMIHANVEKQVQLAKMMFLAHIGDTYLTTSTLDEEGKVVGTRKELLERSVASMLSHCSRTGIVLPPNDNSELVDQMMEAVLGNDTGKAAGIYGRFAATHSTINGMNVTQFKELKGVCLKKQYGMDLAIGGLGNPGVKGANGTGQLLNMDGTCGHMYLHVNKGEKGKTSSLLVGFESDAPHKTNQMGHTHTSKAAQESMSSFLGQRSDEMGDKYGGRTVDCTMYAADDLKKIVEDFTSHYRAMMYEAIVNPTARAQMEETNKLLSGRLMNGNELKLCLKMTGLKEVRVNSIVDEVTTGKRDHANKQVTKPIKQETYQARNIRQEERQVAVPESLVAIDAMPEMKKPGLRTRIKAAFGSQAAKTRLARYKSMIATKAKSVRMSFGNLLREENEASAEANASKKTGKQPKRQNANMISKKDFSKKGK